MCEQMYRIRFVFQNLWKKGKDDKDRKKRGMKKMLIIESIKLVETYKQTCSRKKNVHNI